MKKLFILLFLLGSVCTFAQRQMENLGRGLVAQKVNKGVYVNWRITGQEWYGTAYNLYRDGVLLNEDPITGASNYTDLSGTAQSVYTVTSVKNGVESTPSTPAIMVTNGYLNISLRDLGVNGYVPNDATMADLDGDGEMEILVKRIYADWSVACQNFSYIEAYKLDGTFLWAINVGPNLTDDVEINVAAFDLDGDGKAEVFMRTSEGTIFGDGTKIGDTNGDGKENYRLGGQYMTQGPEFLSLIDGETGKELDRVDYIPRTFGGKTVEEIWGDGYGHRCSKYFFGAPYLDGKKPSLFIGRGIYTRTVMRTYDVVDKKLVFKWEFNSDDNPSYAGQGFHNYTIADVDGDGCDEIVWGSMVVNNDGKGLYSTQLGHGDAMHVGDLDPYHKGQEIWTCLENTTGVALREAATGKILLRRITGRDTGRSMAANVTNDFPGAALGGGPLTYSATTRSAVTHAGGMTANFRIYWDGDLLEETFDYNRFSEATGGGEGAVFKWGKSNPIFTTSGALTNNWTKGTASLQADILGDWREEIIMRSADNKSLRIYMTTDPTEHRFYTLLHDMQYRQAICWQMCGYNQPPHVSFFLGDLEGVTLPPPPVLTNDKLVYRGDGSWAGASWVKNGSPVAYSNDASLLFDADEGGTVTVSGSVSPELLTVNSLGNYTLKGGSLTGSMQLNKQGPGALTLSSTLLYTGATELWDGVTVLTSDLENSPVWMSRFAELNLKGHAKKGIIQEYGSILRVGENDAKAVATVSDSLWLKSGAQVDLDIYDADFTADLLKVNGNLILVKDAVFNLIPHLSGEKIKPGEYLLAEVSGRVKGEVSDLEITGLEGIACSLTLRGGKIYLGVMETRGSGAVVWNGGNNEGEWNLASTKNFLNEGIEDYFVTGDRVVMNEESTSKVVQITADVSPASLLIDAASNYKITGNKAITGQATFTKRGSGTVTIENTNAFTGKVELLEGTVSVSSLANSAMTVGSLGGLKNNAADFVIDGATLQIYNDDVITSSNPMTIGERGATFHTVGEMRLEGAMVGTGQLIKTGSSMLTILHAGNTNSGGTLLNAGTLAMGGYRSVFGKVGSPLILSGGTVQIFDNDDPKAVPNFNYAVVIPRGSTARLNAGARCALNGSFSGEGTLNLYVPYVRTDMFANWSQFSGKLNVTGRDFRMCQNIDMSGTALTLGDGVYMGHYRAGSGATLSATTKIGSLSSDVTTCTVANGTYNVGYNNTNSTYKGLLSGVTVNKYGTANWTLTGENNTATLNIYGGRVLANAPSGFTTTGMTHVRSGGTLAGSGSVKNVTVYEGGTLEAAPGTILVGRFTVGGALNLNKGKLFIKRRSTRNDKLIVTGSVRMTNAVIEIDATSAFSAGNELSIITASEGMSGTFSILPSSPGTGLKWDTSQFLSDGVLKVIETPEGLQDLGADGSKIYPTVVTDVCHVDVSATCQGAVSMELFDASGRMVLSRAFEASEQQTIDMSGYHSGTYFLVLKAANEKLQQTLTKL